MNSARGGSLLLKASLVGLIAGGATTGALAQSEGAGESVVLDEITVEATGVPAAETGYIAPTSINRVEAEPIDTPQTVTAVTAARIVEEDIWSDLDLLNAQPAVSATIREGFLTVRGYGATRAINGIPIGSFVGRTSADLTPFEQVEVLKGPAAIFQGSGGFGGVVNYSFKRPQAAQHVDTILGIGHPDSKRAMVDYNAPALLNDRLRLRFVGSYEDRDSNRYPEGYERTSLFGTAEFDITDRTMVRVAYWDQKNDEVRDFREGLPTYLDGSLIDFPVDTTAVQDWTLYPFRSKWLSADLEHQFNEDWRAKFTYMKGESYHPAERSAPFGCVGPLAVYDYSATGIDPANPDGRQCHTLYYWNDWNQYEIFDLSLNGAFDLFGREHGLLLGATQERSWFRRAFGVSDEADEFLVDIFDPDHHVIDKPGYTRDPFGPKEDANEYRAFAQVNIQATDRLSFPIGGRWTWIKTETGEWTTKGKFTPSLAAVYEMNDNLTFYAQHAKLFDSYNQSYAWNPDWEDGVPRAAEEGNLLPYVTGTQTEIGVKALVFGGRALATAALFDIVEENRPREDTDPDHPYIGFSPFSVPTGETRSRGFEVGLNGEVRPGWTVGAGYAYVDAEYTKDDFVEGTDIGTPKHSGNIWTNYRFQSGPLDRLSLGAGIDFQSSFKGYSTDENDTNRVKAPGYGIVSARVGYDVTDQLTASLNVDNLFDKKYYAEVDAPGWGNYYGDTRRVTFNIRSRF